jgi:putative tricarboxylic transport membrane protein
MRRREITSSLFWMLVGLTLTVWSATYPFGNLAQPGTGFLPLGLGILLLIFSMVLLVRAFKIPAAQKEKEKVPILPERWLSLATTVLVLIACVFLFEKVGYLLIFFAISLILPLLAGQITLKRSFLFAVVSTAGVYIIFVWLLKQPLPTGFLGR